jgi:adenosylmethionine-8-amino-7-oxononanoate aminotransferase
MHPTRVMRVRLDDSYPEVVRASGMTLYGSDGREYLDGVSGAFIANIGYGVRPVIEAMSEMSERLSYCSPVFFTSGVVDELADVVIDLASPEYSHVHFVNSGSEAVDAMVKLARLYQHSIGQAERYKIITFAYDYHGSSIGALSCMADSSGFIRSGKWAPLLSPAFRQVTGPNCAACPWGLSYPDCRVSCAQEVRRAILREDPHTVAAVMANGHALVPEGFWAAVKQVCDDLGVLFIVDEVLSGFGRMGRPFAMQEFGIVPQLTAFAKGANGGYAPLGGVLVHWKIHDAVLASGARFHSQHTTAAHPVACAAALAVQRYAKDHQLFDKVAPRGERLRKAISDLPVLREGLLRFRSKGLFFELYVRTPKLTAKQPTLNLQNAVIRRAIQIALDERLVLTPVSWDGSTLMLGLGPAFIMDDATQDDLVARLDRTLTRYAQTSELACPS